MKYLLLVCALSLSLGGATATSADLAKSATDLLNSRGSPTNPVDYETLDFNQGLLSALTANLGVTDQQAAGGTGALLNQLKNTLSGDEFALFADQLPDLDIPSLLKAVPDISSSSSAAGMLGKSGEAIAGTQAVYSQFKALGLSTGQVAEYVQITQAYLQSEAGEGALELFQQGLGALARL